MDDCCDHKGKEIAAPPASNATQAPVAQAVFRIQKMDCPTEEKLIRDRLGGMDGIQSMRFDLLQRELTVQHTLGSVEPILTALAKLDLEPKLAYDSLAAADRGLDDDHDALMPGYQVPGSKWALMGVSGVAAVSAELVAWTTGNEQSWLVIGLALVAIGTGGLDTLRKGWIALRNFSLNMNFLMSLAVIGAGVIGQWPEAAMVVVLFAIAEMIEALSLDRARNAIQGLMAMTPDMATVKTESGQWQEVAAKTVALKALVRVKPGERIALDGVVAEGQSTVNQAPITGESMPVAKQPGDPVFAGTLNERGAFEFTVTALQRDSTLSRIVKVVQQTQGDRAPTQRFVDQFARYYIPAVVVLAIGVALFAPLVLGAPFQPWFYKALVLLVIACPCALVISTPVTVVSGLAAAARQGILIKGGVYLEQGRLLKALALDKTGTITVGKPVVTDLAGLVAQPEAQLVRLAASLAYRSDHPVSSAVVAHWKLQASAEPLFEVGSFEALTGRGVKGEIAGQVVYLGNHRLVHELGICGPDLESTLQAFEQDGKTVTLLASASAPLLLLAVADTVRETSMAAIAELLSLGLQVLMLTGDNAHTAKAIADKVGLVDARGELLPEDKLAVISELVAKHGQVGMVGDGINDAPALAKASIGFAMGAAGTDTALETADVALMDDDLRKIAVFIRLSAKTRSILVQNITVALGIKAVFLVLALIGKATLWMAVFADMGASLIVVANGLRLLRKPPVH